MSDTPKNDNKAQDAAFDEMMETLAPRLMAVLWQSVMKTENDPNKMQAFLNCSICMVATFVATFIPKENGAKTIEDLTGIFRENLKLGHADRDNRVKMIQEHREMGALLLMRDSNAAVIDALEHVTKALEALTQSNTYLGEKVDEITNTGKEPINGNGKRDHS